MKNILSVFLVIIGLSLSATAEDNHTPEYCSLADAKVCAYLGHMTELVSSKEVQFIAHFLTATEITDLKVILKMGHHDHGSAPVTINRTGPNHYQVIHAYFPMVGEWQVVMDFKFNGIGQQISIPLQIKE